MVELDLDNTEYLIYPRVSKLMVLQSAAGYYIGRLYLMSKHESEPYSRESNYFQDPDVAQRALENNTYIQKL